MSSRKKIAILVDLELNDQSGGHVKFWERISQSLVKKKLNIDLVFFFLGKKKKTIKVSENINFHIYKPGFSSSNLSFLGIDADTTDLSPINLGLFFELRNYNLIHTTDQLHCMAKTAKLASRIWKTPLTTSYHTDTPSYTEYYVLEILKKLPKFLDKLFIKKLRIHKKISVSQKDKIREYIKDCKFAFVNDDFSHKEMSFLKDNKIKVSKISRGIDKKIFFKKEINKNVFLNKYKINPKNKLIFFCGRIHKLKGAVLLSQINKILVEEGFNVTTVMAGENIHGEECLKVCKKNLLILDYINQTEVSKFYNICDLFVFPSIYETGPQVVLEARSCGAVCIVSKDGGGKRIKKNREDGIILNNLSPENWSVEIIKLLKNKKKIKLMKDKVQLSNNYPSWEDIFYDIFFEKWKSII